MNNTTLLLPQESMEHDTTGAIIYIIVVVLWYSLGIGLLLGMQMISSAKIVESSLKYSNKLMTPSFREKTNHKEILGKEEYID
jgi:hypothetical protein